MSGMYAKHPAVSVSIYCGSLSSFLVVKLSKIGENPENYRKIFAFEANKTTEAKSFSKFFILFKRTSNCRKTSINVDGLR